MNQDEREEWRDIEDFEGLYAVSDKGRVMNLKSGKILKPRVNNYGYERICLHKNGKLKECYIHRLVAQAFIPNTEQLREINHLDECKTNNDVENLEWCDRSHNIKHSAHKRSFRVNQLALDGQFIKEWKSFNEIERETGFDKSNIINCCKGRYKKMYGYRWEYADGLHQRNYNRPIIVSTKEDDYIAEFRNLPEASRCLGIPKISIWFALNGVFKTSHGFKFRYLDELSQEIKSEDEKLNNNLQIKDFN